MADGAAGGGGGLFGLLPGRRVKASKKGLRGARRRLSVVSDNKLVEGVAALGDTVGEEVTKADAARHVVYMSAGVSKKGYAPYNPRKKNQDAIITAEHPETGAILFGVMDGHGEAGDLVSHYIASRFPKQVFANKYFPTDPSKAMGAEIDRLERAILADASVDTDFSGTTSVTGVVRGNVLYVNNIGDSRVILARETAPGKLEAVEVSLDHKPDRPSEQARIEARGGRVFAVEYEDGVDGPPRVWLGNMDIPGLAMARSLGDAVAHTAGVISEPEIHAVELTKADKVLVFASDGLWEFMSNQEVVDMIAATGMKDPKTAVDVLIDEANARWMREEQVIDDTTVIVAFLKV